MDVLLSWSGKASYEVASSLRDWLPDVLPGVVPWISSEDIAKGQRWAEALHDQLAKTKYCIACITSENVKSPWVFYEVGYIASRLAGAICPYLVGVSKKLMSGNPLGLYQCTDADKTDTWRMIRDLHAALSLGHPLALLEGNFAARWPALRRKVERATASAPPVEDPVTQTDPPLQQLLSEDAKELLVGGRDGKGYILYALGASGRTIEANGKNYLSPYSPRNEARWKEAISDLERFHLVEPQGDKRERFRLTYKGYQVADALSPPPEGMSTNRNA